MTESEMSKTAKYRGREGRKNARQYLGFVRKISERTFGYPGREALAFFNLSGTELVLDAGSGSGFYTLMLAESLRNGKILALDQSSEMLQVLAKKVRKNRLNRRVEVLECDILDVPMADESADAALSIFVWHYLDHPVDGAKELFRLLKPGGKVFIADFLGDADKGGHHGSMNSQEMKTILQESGFTGVRTYLHHKKIVIGTAIKPV